MSTQQVSSANPAAIRTANLLVFVPFALTHFLFGWKVSRGYDGPNKDIPLMAVGEWAWLGWAAMALFVICFQIFQWLDQSYTPVVKQINSQYFVSSALQIVFVLIWTNSRNYLASFIMATLLFLSVASTYIQLHFGPKPSLTKTWFKFASVDALYSVWVVWSLYLAHYTGFQAFGITHHNMSNMNSWITVFFLLVLAATSVGFALNTKARPAGDFVAVFIVTWLEWGVYSSFRYGDKKIMWVSGAMGVLTSCVLVYALFATYQAYEARIFLTDDEEEDVVDERRALLG